MHQGRDRRCASLPGEAGGAPGDRPHRVAQEDAQAQRLACRCRRHFALVRGFALEVEQDPQHPHPADAVGQGMVDPEYERCPTALDAFNQREFPQWTIPVEGVHRRLACEFHHHRPGVGAGAETRRRCQLRSKCASSVHRGVVSGNRGSAMRWRSRSSPGTSGRCGRPPPAARQDAALVDAAPGAIGNSVRNPSRGREGVLRQDLSAGRRRGNFPAPANWLFKTRPSGC